jgi:uncharacterized SAM-binding protein YcdF (DUF218 family)
MSWLLTNLIDTFLLHPLSILMLLGIGIACTYRHPKLARAVLIATAALLYTAATPYCSQAALHALEGRYAPLSSPHPDAQAIVILGGGSYFHAPEYGGNDTVNPTTLARLRYGAKLQRATGSPILVSGGIPEGNARSEASQMRAVLKDEFKVPVSWEEQNSDNTLENARNSYRILAPLGIHTLYLVTHASHMPRAANAFRAAGFTVTPAPTVYTTRNRTDVMSFLPTARGLLDSKIYLHEMFGLLWYRIKSSTN